MFPSACSLRSTQCAALIALATAAGISRFDADTTAQPTDTPAPSHAAFSPLTSVRVTCFRLALNVLAPWLRTFDPTMATLAANDATDADHAANSARAGDSFPAHADLPDPLAVNPPLAAATIVLTRDSNASLSPQHHFFPYAVGPPANTLTFNRPVAGTSVPCDSATRSVVPLSVSRIAQFEFVSAARLARLLSAGASVARYSFGQVVLRDAATSLSAAFPSAAAVLAFPAVPTPSASFVTAP